MVPSAGAPVHPAARKFHFRNSLRALPGVNDERQSRGAEPRASAANAAICGKPCGSITCASASQTGTSRRNKPTKRPPTEAASRFQAQIALPTAVATAASAPPMTGIFPNVPTTDPILSSVFCEQPMPKNQSPPATVLSSSMLNSLRISSFNLVIFHSLFSGGTIPSMPRSDCAEGARSPKAVA